MSAAQIAQSVGRRGTNLAADVRLVQGLLLSRGFARVGDADGVCGPRTIEAIVEFQSGFMRRPDGRIDPGGNSWRFLAGTYTGVVTPSPTTPAPADPPSSALTRTVPRPPRESLNPGLRTVSNAFMLARLGRPRESFDQTCRPPTLPRLRRNTVRDDVGPFTVVGLVPAVLSLKAVLIDIQREQPAVYRVLGTAGMLCCRLVRGSASAISNHSWGTAIDLTLAGELDVYGNERVQHGLSLIAPIFNRHGWIWGAAFRTEDGMHFEACQALIEAWQAQLL